MRIVGKTPNEQEWIKMAVDILKYVSKSEIRRLRHEEVLAERLSG